MALVVPRVVVAGVEFLAESWNCNFPSYGSVGTYEVTTSRKELARAGLDLYAATLNSHPLGLDIFISVDGVETHLWGGEIDDTDWDFDTDTVTISGRDWAGILVDQKITLANFAPESSSLAVPSSTVGLSGGPATSYNVQNQSAVSLLSQIAKAHGLIPEPLNVSTEEATVPVGNILAENAVFSSQPLPEWEIIQAISRIYGWNTYVTPNKKLVFGPPKVSLNKLRVGWNLPTLPPGVLPCFNLQVQHQPRRNNSFLVVVETYNVSTLEVHQALVGLPSQHEFLTYPLFKANKAGFYTTTSLGPNVSAVTALFKNLGKEVYLIHKAGLTPSQASRLAESIALDLAKREIIVSFSLDGNPSIKPFDTLELQGSLSGFEGRKFFVQQVHHSFELPDGGSIGTSGFLTHVKAWTLPLYHGVTQIL